MDPRPEKAKESVDGPRSACLKKNARLFSRTVTLRTGLPRTLLLKKKPWLIHIRGFFRSRIEPAADLSTPRASRRNAELTVMGFFGRATKCLGAEVVVAMLMKCSFK